MPAGANDAGLPPRARGGAPPHLCSCCGQLSDVLKTPQVVSPLFARNATNGTRLNAVCLRLLDGHRPRPAGVGLLR